MSENKQTAVEFLFDELFNSIEKYNSREYSFDEYIKQNLIIREQAKQMEKEQILEAYSVGYSNGQVDSNNTAKKYYKETYGEDKSES